MEITFRKLIGHQIRAIRKKKGLTQEKLADRAQLTYQYIGAVERGARNISIDSLERIISALGVDISKLLDLGGVESFPLTKDESNKSYMLALLNHKLKDRSSQEIRVIHNITEEIIKILPIRETE